MNSSMGLDHTTSNCTSSIPSEAILMARGTLIVLNGVGMFLIVLAIRRILNLDISRGPAMYVVAKLSVRLFTLSFGLITCILSFASIETAAFPAIFNLCYSHYLWLRNIEDLKRCRWFPDCSLCSMLVSLLVCGFVWPIASTYALVALGWLGPLDGSDLLGFFFLNEKALVLFYGIPA